MSEEGSVQEDSPQAPADMETDDMCWICLDDTKDRDPLVSPCKCPRKVHPRCLARWQLQQAGRLEETNCRFCQCNLADWKASLTPENLKPEVQRVQPIMVVYFEGQIHRIPVKQGPDGLKEFTHRIRELFRLPEDVDISLTFGCKEPLSGQHLKLEGIGAFDAAVHCASVAAAERQQKLKSGGGAAAPGSAADPAGSEAAAASGNTAATAGGGGAPGLARTLTAPPRTLPFPHTQHLSNHQQQYALHGSHSGPSASSAPGSSQGSDGGGGQQPLLHPAASAPALSQYAADSSASPTRHGASESRGAAAAAGRVFDGYGSLSDGPGSTANSGYVSGHGGAAADSAPLHVGGAAGGLSVSPFQSAAYGALASYGSAAAAGEPARGAALRSHATAPVPAAGAAAAAASRGPAGVPIVDAISGPATTRLVPAASTTPGNTHANGIAYTALSGLQQYQSYQHAQLPPGYGPPPSYAPAPYTLPPLLPAGSGRFGGGAAAAAQSRQHELQQQQQPAGGRSSWPPHVPPTPRDHYDASAQSPHSRPAQSSFHHYHYHYFQQQPCPGQQPAQYQPQLFEAGAAGPNTASGACSPNSGPSTPVRPIATRRPSATPTTPPPALPPLPALSTPLAGPAAPAGRHHPYYPDDDPRLANAMATGLGPLQAGLMAAAPPANDYGNANRRPRPTSSSSPRSEYESALPSPAADGDPQALGSLTGRLKFSLRAFSRKVARSLTFQRGGGGSGSVGGTPCVSPRPVSGLLPEAEASEAGAEAEVGTTAGGRVAADCGVAAAAAAPAGMAVGAGGRDCRH